MKAGDQFRTAEERTCLPGAYAVQLGYTGMGDEL